MMLEKPRQLTIEESLEQAQRQSELLRKLVEELARDRGVEFMKGETRGERLKGDSVDIP